MPRVILETDVDSTDCAKKIRRAVQHHYGTYVRFRMCDGCMCIQIDLTWVSM
jgi:hypothetical protein